MSPEEEASKRRAGALLTRRILLGAALGILCGLFFGELASVVEPLGGVYIALLQMVVFPFLISSLLHGLGSMNPGMARRLFGGGWPAFLLVWGVTLLTLWLASLAIPGARPPTVVTAGHGEGISRVVSLLVPANPFIDLTRNYVPAVVIFSVIYGIAIQAQKGKENILGVFSVIKAASVTIWGWVIKMAPLGVFALFADLAGTVRFELLGSLLLYLVLFFGAALLLTFWILPGILAAFVPVGHRRILSELRTALVMAVATTLPITAVPFIIDLAERLVTRVGGREKDEDAVVSTVVAVGYPVVQAGNLFVFLFMSFAVFYFHAAPGLLEWGALPVLTVLSTVGTPVSTVDAVSFLNTWMNLPPQAGLLYVEMMTITRYPQVLVSAMAIAFVAILTPFSYYGLTRFQPVVLIRTVLVGLAGMAVMGWVAAAGGGASSRGTPDPYLALSLDPALTRAVNATVHRAPVPVPASDLRDTDRIRASGTLRVGYAPNVIPFSYFNARGELVGYDIAHAYALARDLNVDLEFVPFTNWPDLDAELNRFDMAVGGIYLTTDRIRRATPSRPYLQSQPALIVRSEKAAAFLDGNALREADGLRIAAFSSDILVPLARQLFPKSEIVVVPDYSRLAEAGDIDAAIWTLDQARAWASSHPGFSAVVPTDFGTPLLMAYLLPRDSREFAVLVDEWLALQRTNGFEEAMKSYWLEGKPGTPASPRWSVLRNVLGWGKP